MNVIRRGDNDGIDVFIFFVQHPPKIRESSRLRILPERPGRSPVIHIAESHDIFAAHSIEIALSSAADADPGNVELFTRRYTARPA
jgi:hypothetical protein